MRRTSVFLIATSLALLALSQPINAQLSLQGILGVAVQLQAGLCTINYLAQDVQLVLQAAGQAAVTLQAIAQAPGQLCTGCAQQSIGLLGGTCGYVVQATGAAVTNIQITSGAQSVLQPSPVTPSAPAACFEHKGGNNWAYHSCTCDSRRKCTATVPGPGTYVFGAAQSNVQVAQGQACNLAANSPQTVTWAGAQGQAAGSVALQYASTAPQPDITCTPSSTPPAGAGNYGQAGTPVGTYHKFKCKSGSYRSTYRYQCKQEDLDRVGCNPRAGCKVKVCHYDSACNCWKTPSSGGSYNADTRVVTQTYTSASASGKHPDVGIFCEK